jgi:ATP-binding cassette subfamily B protein
LALSLLATPLTLLTPVPLQIAVDSVVGDKPVPGYIDTVLPGSVTETGTALLVAIAVMFVLIALVRAVQQLATTLLRTYTGERLVLRLRTKLFARAQRLSLPYHDKQGTTDSTYRIQYDAMSIQYIAADGVIPFIASAFTVVAMLFVTASIDWQLALVALAVTPVMIALFHVFRRRLRTQARDVKLLESSAMSVAQEVLGAIRIVKAFAQEDREEERFTAHSGHSMRARIRLAIAEGMFGLCVGLTIAAGTATVLYVGVLHVQAGVLTLGELLLVMSYLTQLYDPLRTVSRKAGSMQSHLASAERAFAVLDEQNDVEERPHARRLRRAAGAVEFRNVSFGYEHDRQILRGLSLSVEPGLRVGIAGRTGAGKTTLVSLLTRFYDPTEGEILLDGVDLRDYRVTDLRNQFAIVLQEPVLFSTSIGENIAYAKPDAGEREVAAAAAAANVHAFIENLPDAYDTPVGERGMRLSGGERQRISLARAFLKDAPILILDEPTSSVDMKTEATIMEAMERLMAGRTTFMIAHRRSTLENCDLRLEIEAGQIVGASREGELVDLTAALLERGDSVVGAASPAKRQKL